MTNAELIEKIDELIAECWNALQDSKAAMAALDRLAGK